MWLYQTELLHCIIYRSLLQKGCTHVHQMRSYQIGGSPGRTLHYPCIWNTSLCFWSTFTHSHSIARKTETKWDDIRLKSLCTVKESSRKQDDTLQNRGRSLYSIHQMRNQSNYIKSSLILLNKPIKNGERQQTESLPNKKAKRQ